MALDPLAVATLGKVAVRGRLASEGRFRAARTKYDRKVSNERVRYEC